MKKRTGEVVPIGSRQSIGSGADRSAERLLIQSITPRNILSFGPDTQELELHRLNVLIGPNGSGKSNLLELLSLIRRAGSDFRPVIQRGGGVSEWVWKGRPDAEASIDAVVTNPGHMPLRYRMTFSAAKQAFHLVDERIENERPYDGESKPYYYYQFRGGYPVIAKAKGKAKKQEDVEQLEGSETTVPTASFDPNLPIMAQRRDPETYPVLTKLGSQLDRIRLYREWTIGRNTVLREPQKMDARNDLLEEDFSNLGLFLNRIRTIPKAKNLLLTRLRDLYEGLTDFDVSIVGGTVQVFFTEGDFSIPATRLSDGSVRYLALLAILLDPDPPPLVGIEEPELGLHPDIIPKLADLLVDASSRTQIVITTHSDSLVDALTDSPEFVVVCDKKLGQTQMRRLNGAELGVWLTQYRLGQLWTRGDLGGTRW